VGAGVLLRGVIGHRRLSGRPRLPALRSPWAQAARSSFNAAAKAAGELLRGAVRGAQRADGQQQQQQHEEAMAAQSAAQGAGAVGDGVVCRCGCAAARHRVSNRLAAPPAALAGHRRRAAAQPWPRAARC
jgi:hypothetical protein